MTIKPSSILQTLACAGLLLQPAGSAAQSRPGPPVTAARRAPSPAAPAAATVPAPAARGWHEEEYRLGPGDKLRVEVYRETQLSQSLQVRPDGRITLPLIGDMAATGRTPGELRDAIATSLKEFVTNPVVTVIVQEAVAAQVFVIGEVASPGAQVMQGPLTVLQALSQAGGLKEFANRSDVRILRKNGSGLTTTIPFDYKNAIKGRVEPVLLQPGDTVVVP
jgi:polysaccharide export outer membrane protein